MDLLEALEEKTKSTIKWSIYRSNEIGHARAYEGYNLTSTLGPKEGGRLPERQVFARRSREGREAKTGDARSYASIEIGAVSAR